MLMVIGSCRVPFVRRTATISVLLIPLPSSRLHSLAAIPISILLLEWRPGSVRVLHRGYGIRGGVSVGVLHARNGGSLWLWYSHQAWTSVQWVVDWVGGMWIGVGLLLAWGKAVWHAA